MSTAKETYLKALGFTKVQEITHPKTAVQITEDNHIEVCQQINANTSYQALRPTHYGAEWCTNTFHRINFGDWIFVTTNGAIDGWMSKERFENHYKIVEE